MRLAQSTFFFLVACVCFRSFAAQADVVSVHCPLGCPESPEGNTLFHGHVYSLSLNHETKFADWVAYEVDVLNFGPSPGRDWKINPLFDEESRLEERDYSGSFTEFDLEKGHQAPLASFAGSPYWEELNYLSNITPQRGDLNGEAWGELEQKVRDAVSFRDSLFVITGTIYDEGPPLDPDGEEMTLNNSDESHLIPAAYFKIVYDLDGQSTAFKMDQLTNQDADYCAQIVPLSDVEDLVDFELPAFQSSTLTRTRLGC